MFHLACSRHERETNKGKRFEDFSSQALAISQSIFTLNDRNYTRNGIEVKPVTLKEVKV